MRNKKTAWPVIRAYEENQLLRVALPVGGIGTGTVSLGGRGDWRDWEIVNRPAKGFGPRNTFFALWTRDSKGRVTARALEGPVAPELYEGGSGCAVANHGLPRFRSARFEAAYPMGRVLLKDKDVPLDVAIEAFNPLIPADAEASGIPVAVLRFVLTNRTGAAVSASVCGSLENFIGADGSDVRYPWGPVAKLDHCFKKNRNQYRHGERVRGVFMYSEELDKDAEQWGTMALSTTATAGVTHRTAWADVGWGDSLLDFWDDFSADGKLEEREVGNAQSPTGSMAVSVRVPARGQKTVTFFLTWHFPNRMTWTAAKDWKAMANGEAGACCEGGSCGNPNWVGNHYATRYADAWAVAEHVSRELPGLEERTVAFVRAMAESDFPDVVKEAVLFNLTALRSQTSFRIADGHFLGWEGCHDRMGCCHGSCTHVWNYEQATAFLFGALSRSMREIEFGHAIDERGLMSFRIHLPLHRAREWGKAAADGQMGCLVKLYRDWQLSGDQGMLRRLWPGARRAMEFCWIENGWDGDRDGVMEGCQHNTMDVEYFGPNPQMQAWYLAALRACEEMAGHLDEEAFARTCRELFDRGKAWTDAHLFNGEYYEHEVRPPGDASRIAPGLLVGMGAKDLNDPELQLGSGCLVDQLVGQFLAHVCGLGYVLDERNVRKTLASVLRYNFKADLSDHFNHMRSFALGEESATLMASYPKGRRPRRPFPYYNEVMTGFEYTAGVGMLYDGMEREGLKVIGAVRARYDGRRRSPFDEAECGHHYARAMAVWGGILALSGFHYSAVTKRMEFGRMKKAGQWFWSTGDAWGVVRQRPGRGGVAVEIGTLGGSAVVRAVAVGEATADLGKDVRLAPGRPLRCRVTD